MYELLIGWVKTNHVAYHLTVKNSRFSCG